ncbi:hypothetical protein SAMN06296273_0308 [Nitrosomonas ureae]|uniref:Uncharacterized protein n=1 Tax=Nitrosomonas ureae TaxID=44577 RepID=A0A285BVH9_9PROT|nr:hypothetical protein [Nitrosomonas ureae]SNX58843.1 hypothetical protein SAMN06296273_0308 [Nitrosomonas ureae]
MASHNKIKFVAGSVIAAAISVIGQNVFAHTVLEVPSIAEGVRASNNVVVGHGCGEINVIGTSVVFPDGVDSTITVDGQPHTGALTDFIQNWGNLNQKIFSKAVFTFQGEKVDANGNVSGFWAGGGDSLPHDMAGFIPFRTSAAIIEPTSCAASVKFHVSIVDICEITPVDGFSDETVNRWTLAGLGTPYDRPEDGAASLTITRSETNPLPESCGGTGQVVEVKPSAAQINRDMPIIFNGSQVWPQ